MLPIGKVVYLCIYSYSYLLLHSLLVVPMCMHVLLFIYGAILDACMYAILATVKH